MNKLRDSEITGEHWPHLLLASSAGTAAGRLGNTLDAEAGCWSRSRFGRRWSLELRAS